MKIISLPAPVAALCNAIAQLEAAYEGRKFTLDGHLLGSIGEVVAQEALGFTLYPMSRPGHDAKCEKRGEVQIKITGVRGKSIAMRAPCNHLVVLKMISDTQAKIVYDDIGSPVWALVADKKMPSNGQHRISLKSLEELQEKRPRHEGKA